MTESVNRLVDESSPYLRQHAHNPVDWYPWGEEAFAAARRDDKPILLSIGYSACHWCHVMERESFEDEAIARLMNEHFVSIKVDREERPDVDHIYMNAVQLLTGRGGWPMTVFLTPDGRALLRRHLLPARRPPRHAGFSAPARAHRPRVSRIAPGDRRRGARDRRPPARPRNGARRRLPASGRGAWLPPPTPWRARTTNATAASAGAEVPQHRRPRPLPARRPHHRRRALYLR